MIETTLILSSCTSQSLVILDEIGRGTITEDFDRLVAEAHKRNIRIIMDLLLNHTSDQHPGFIESRSSRDNPKRDWYLWADPPKNRKRDYLRGFLGIELLYYRLKIRSAWRRLTSWMEPSKQRSVGSDLAPKGSGTRPVITRNPSDIHNTTAFTDVADYCDVDPLFGTLEDFDQLVAETHKRGMKIIIDYVPNHTSDQHPWFIESRSSRDNPKRDWYIWRDPKPDGSAPNNWGSFFGGPAWTLDEKTGQCYLHQFVKEQPELNWRNPEVRKAMLDVLRFWMERGVDGFRMDVIGLLIKDKDLRDNPPNPNANPNLPANDLFGRQMHVFTEDQDEVHDILKDIRKLLDAFDDRCSIGELWGSMDRWIRYYGENNDELHLPFNFRLMWQPWSSQAMRACVDEMEGSLPPFAWPNYVLGNHDQWRVATRFGGLPQARLAGMMLLTLRGTPTFYYGDEIGLENGIIPPEKIQDPQGINLGAERTRDVARTPMQWDASPNAGFSPAEPWLPVTADYTTRNVVSEKQDPGSMLNFYRRLFWLRRGSAALQGGNYKPLDVEGDCFVYLRESGSERKLVVLNFGSESLTAATNLKGTGRLVLSTHTDREGEVSLASLNLRPYEGLLIDLP